MGGPVYGMRCFRLWYVLTVLDGLVGASTFPTGPYCKHVQTSLILSKQARLTRDLVFLPSFSFYSGLSMLLAKKDM